MKRSPGEPIAKLLGPPDSPGGYRPGDRQQSRLMRLQFDARHIDGQGLERVAHWLNERCALHWAVPPRLPPAEHPSALPARFVGLVLLLAHGLRQWARNPAFEPGRLLFIGPIRGGMRHEARVAVPGGYGLPDHRLESIYQHAALMVLRGQPSGESGLTEASIIDRISTILSALRGRPGVVSATSFQVLNAAWQSGLPFMGLAGGISQIGWGQRAFRSDRSNGSDDGAIGALVSQDKALTAELLTRAGLPAPVHRVVTTLDEARTAARVLGFPIVIKPANRDRGEGVTTRIDTPGPLDAAFREARQLSKRVLVERQIEGVCHRIFIARGQLLYVVRRDPQSIFGDGRHSIHSLIEHANALEAARLPWMRGEPYPADELAVQTVFEQGLDMASIPAAGRRVALRPIESTRWGGVDTDLTAHIHPDNTQAAIEAARLIGLSNAGVDLITTDISVPWYQNGGVINEVNFAPALGLADISRSHLPEFLRRHVAQDGRIPIHMFVGREQAARQADQRHQALCAHGARAGLTRTGLTRVGLHALPQRPEMSLFDRIHACLMRTDIEDLTIVADDPSILESGLPVDRLDTVQVAFDETLSADVQWQALARMMRKLGPVRTDAPH